ncbi:hypothetical protein D3C78_1750090 [compost metagenome]
MSNNFASVILNLIALRPSSEWLYREKKLPLADIDEEHLAAVFSVTICRLEESKQAVGRDLA